MKKITSFLFSVCLSSFVFAQTPSFDIVPLGVYGGGLEGNLSAYLIGEHNANEFICFDAGTVGSGIKKAVENKTFTTTEADVLQNYIKGYFITHGHLDHNSGLIINSPSDAKKPIYGFDFVIDIYKDHYFINSTWINFANDGQTPILNKYQYHYLTAKKPVALQNTKLTATPFVLDHVKPYKSSAALIADANQNYVLYLSDTGADRLEKSEQLKNLWQYVAPLIKNKQLKAILIEVSFPNAQPEHLLFGHLTPNLLQEELASLAQFTGKKALKNLNVIITHIKPEGDNEAVIQQELLAKNPYHVHYIFPKQGEKISL
ncbi:3',5'-cyclic-nucleotide phosphodiesterase [Flavobacterium agricola]|uniref:3',5'-cyclic-nucleotide phosphodiesterase n=1 Tax=Flavobacterium agricola TaxID=2870839 RepID=A0ABY6M4Z1_9FLAO|nr:3',5'-cyclic-nucleotide phosphodiesterase [Flavobacterium agricola]UYW02333.1 3',5'-cyclic-nucleotide phosphodiesterase [Flavobacterium agricola]